MDEPWRITSAAVENDALVVSGILPSGVRDAQLVLIRSSGSRMTFPAKLVDEDDATSFQTTIPMEQVVDASNPDDPFIHRTSRVVRVVTEDADRPLIMTSFEQGVSQVHHSRLLSLTRSPSGLAVIHEAPVRLTADTVEADDSAGTDRLVVGGPLWESADAGTLFWRRFLPDGNDLDVACEVSLACDRWSAVLNVADVMAWDQTAETEAVATGSVNWTLFASSADGKSVAVQSEPFLSSQLPLELSQRYRRVVVSPREGMVHLDVL
jgi:CDP-glycerol glycerophosphotransferase